MNQASTQEGALRSMCCMKKLPGIKRRLSTVRYDYDLHQTQQVVLFLITFYNIHRIFNKRIELTHSTIFFSHMNEQNITIKQLNDEILPMYIHMM